MPNQTPSTEIKVIETRAGIYSRIFFGIFCMVVGTTAAIFGLWLDFSHETGACTTNAKVFWTLSHSLMVAGGGASIFGGMILPSVFDSARPVLTYVLDRLPWTGVERRVEQVQPPTPPTEPPNA